MNTLPTLFVSHGAPSLAVEDGPARRFLADLGRTLPRPRGILVASAHWPSHTPTLDVSARPRTIHDFRGFPPELSRIEYRVQGAIELAHTAEGLLARAGIETAPAVERGLDHGAWVPLSLLYPHADVPVAQISIQPQRDAAWHLALGAALASLREAGNLVIGSGSLTHNLGAVEFADPHAAPPSWVTEFAEAVAAAIARRDAAALLDWRRLPHGEANHPTPEHLLPLFVALGAAGAGAAGRRLHTSSTYRVLAMDVYAFEPAATVQGAG